MKSFHFNSDCSIMRDDPIRLIMKIQTLGQNRNNLRILKYCFLFMFFLIEILLTIPGIYLIMNNINFITFTEYFTPYSFLQPGCASFIIMGKYLLSIEKITSGMYNISKVLEMQTPTFELKISKKARKCNIISILIPILSACIHLLCLPTLIDDGFGTLIFYTVKRFFGDGPNWFYICVTILFLSVDGLILMIPMLFTIYFTFHVQFQLMWLNEYVEQNLHMKNIREQEIVHLHLLNVVKYHLCFKAAFDTIDEIKKFTIILVSLAGAIVAIMCIYNIKSDTHQSRSFRIYLVMAILISNTVIICLCGQAISDESMKLRDKLYDSPWYYWNIKNMRILLMIITNIRDPWEYSFYNLISINHQFFTKGTKLAYSVAAVLSKME